MGIFDSKSFSLTFSVELYVLLALFIIGMIASAVLIYNPSNVRAAYKKRGQVPDTYYHSNNSGELNTVSTSYNTNANPFYQEAEAQNNQRSYQQTFPRSGRDNQGKGPGDSHTFGDEPNGNNIPLEPITLAVSPSASKS